MQFGLQLSLPQMFHRKVWVFTDTHCVTVKSYTKENISIKALIAAANCMQLLCIR